MLLFNTHLSARIAFYNYLSGLYLSVCLPAYDVHLKKYTQFHLKVKMKDYTI